MALKVCAESGCPTLTNAFRCAVHARKQDRARGTRQQRGYDATHERLRADWAPKVATGKVHCAKPECRRFIRAGEPWDLGHTVDRTGYRGPEHARCNRSDGGRAAHVYSG